MVEENSGEIRAETVRSKGISGIVVNYGVQLAKFSGQFVYQVLMMRMLSPADFGLVAMATPIMLFAALLADGGLTQAAVQRQNITQPQLSTLFYLNVTLGAFLAVVVALSGGVVSSFYGEPRLGPILVAMSAMLLLGGFYSQLVAILNRRLAFTRTATIDLGGFFLGSVAGLATAAMGWGYWAVIANQLVTISTALVLSWILCRWIPGRPAPLSEVRQLVGFGLDMTIASFLNFFSRNLDNVLIGKFAGEVQLGYYDRAYKLLLLPLSQITVPIGKVAVPLLSRSLQDKRAYSSAFFMMLETVILMTYPLIAVALITASELVELAFGPRWAEIVPIFAVLGIGGFFAPISHSASWLLVTQGRTATLRNWGAASAAMFIASFFAGLPWGALGVAIAYIAVGCVQGPLFWYGATRRGLIATSDLVDALLPYWVAVCAAAAAGYAARQLDLPPMALIALVAVVVFATFFAVVGMFPRSRATIRKLLRLAGEALDRQRTALVAARARR